MQAEPSMVIRFQRVPERPSACRQTGVPWPAGSTTRWSPRASPQLHGRRRSHRSASRRLPEPLDQQDARDQGPHQEQQEADEPEHTGRRECSARPGDDPSQSEQQQSDDRSDLPVVACALPSTEKEIHAVLAALPTSFPDSCHRRRREGARAPTSTTAPDGVCGPNVFAPSSLTARVPSDAWGRTVCAIGV